MTNAFSADYESQQKGLAEDIASASRSRRATRSVAKHGITPLPKRDLPTPKAEPKTDRIRRANSFTNGAK